MSKLINLIEKFYINEAVDGVGVVNKLALSPSKETSFRFVTDIREPNITLPIAIHNTVVNGLEKHNIKILPPPRPMAFIFELLVQDENDKRGHFGLNNEKTVKDVIATLKKHKLLSE